ncbi:hypothetical protein [Cecembia calidifontis]|jgi:hypothetical protein|uniref:Uncharacterized protein n=1 Tax=Cecembia calidifontis TaxID=1187080 RepID=A0A4Q7P7G7_9BACT|nr:hypothetical protein [Cecembia calidifontis]RZS95414.1 hypothetical protein BC751_0938 [Cecembia calidifontis]RZS95416.1 hypothetical protein BC751_0944 [Cecembia calidifontis]RZS95420.1 hypothetical protein BC751_0950 [Cecembia calidifontis]
MDKLALGLSAITLIYGCLLYLSFNFREVMNWLNKLRLSTILVREKATVKRMSNQTDTAYKASDRMAA